MTSFAQVSYGPLRTCRSHRRWLKHTSRGLHSLPSFPYLDQGFGKFLPPSALNTLVNDWHQGLLTRLNEQVRDTRYATASVMQTIVSAAPIRADTLIFNYASLAANNHFFLEHLKPPPTNGETTHEDSMDVQLEALIRNDFGSKEQFKSTFGGYALGMNTSGYIWVCTNPGATQLVILPTFGPGTLLVRTRSYAVHQNTKWGGLLVDSDRSVGVVLTEELKKQEQQRLNPVEQSSENLSAPAGVSPQSPVSGISTNPFGASFTPPGARSYSTDSLGNEQNVYHPSSQRNRQNPQTKSAGLYTPDGPLYPLFCCSLYEHSWMSAGYGVWGKEDWLKEFWTVLDWEKVQMNWNFAKNPPKIEN
ncbi:manganese superoxide dismutase [Flagelloscypha sp. PMI_526]|nr:manganese superoxide dismutase [Flagelloscypha sp. PMI_526]